MLYRQICLQNTAAAAAYCDEFAVSVVDGRVETGGCTVDADDTDLADRMNTALEWLTDGGEIGFEEWADCEHDGGRCLAGV